MNTQTNEINICKKLLHIIYRFAGKATHHYGNNVYPLQDVEAIKAATSSYSLSVFEIEALIHEGS